MKLLLGLALLEFYSILCVVDEGTHSFRRFGTFVSKVPLHGLEVVVCMALATLRFEELNEAGGYAGIPTTAFLSCFLIRIQVSCELLPASTLRSQSLNFQKL